jgi:hypothetical protein
LVTVNLGGFTQVMPWKGAPPWAGDRVRVDTQGGSPVCELIEGAPYGSVIEPDGDYLRVTGDDAEEYRYVFVGTDVFTGGERVALDHARKLVLGQLSTDPAFDVPDTPTAPPPGSGGSTWFAPVWSGNWRDGSFAGDAVEISTSRVGMYGFGTQIRDTVPDGATITRAELHLSKEWESGNTTTVPSSMGTHGWDGRPGSTNNSALTGTYLIDPNATVVDIRGAVADQLKTGAALGVGFRSGSNGWRRYSAAPVSGRIFMEWT